MDASKYKNLYLQEARERIAAIETELVELEKDPSGTKPVETLFRSYHSIKGMSASMGYELVQRFSHAQEDLLDAVRSKKLGVTGDLISLLLECLDKMKALAEAIEHDAEQNEAAVDAMIVKIQAAKTAPPPSAAPAKPEAEPEEKKQAAAPRPVDEQKQHISIADTIKVERAVFDKQLDITGNLMTELSRLKAEAENVQSMAMHDIIRALERSLDELRENILDARMVKFDSITQTLPRIVRDVCRNTGKEAEIIIEGASIAMDRSVLETMSDPLIHIIRNAVDHGLEPPADRKKAKKPEKGTIKVRALSRRDRIFITITDDGRGIDRDRIREKALQSMPQDRVMSMTDKELLMLICLPGFSTAKQVSDISGRGVGMDIVKSTIDDLGGDFTIDSILGKGTIMTIELPKASSMMKLLVVRVGNEQFSLPLSKVHRVIEAERSEISTGRIEYYGKSIKVSLLKNLLRIPDDDCTETLRVALLETGVEGDELFALAFDDFVDDMDAYIRPLAPPFSSIWCAAGITILGNGRPVFLLDIPQLASV
ncbi:MAG: ATP-binding protein [Deltaproteobacteria bacterium]|nr:ATP-binding protein [Deltaproteobacteria bacterium]